MKKIIFSIFVAITAIALSSCGGKNKISVSNSINSIIDGYIYDSETQTAIEDVEVFVSGKTTKTDENGYFKITGLNPGTYSARLKKEGYLTQLMPSDVKSPLIEEYYGDAMQTGSLYYLNPTNKQVKIVILYEYLDTTDNSTKYAPVPQGIKIKVDYNSLNSPINNLNKFPTFTTNSAGEITIPSVSDEYSLNISFYETIEDYRYSGSNSYDIKDYENKNYTIKLSTTRTKVVPIDYHIYAN